MNKIRVAIVGCGGIANAHANAYRANQEQCELVACADTVPAAAQSFGTKYNCQPFSDIELMLDSVKPDAISICTPPNSHLPLTAQAAAKKINVLCEKPMARNSAEAAQMVDIVTRSGITFMNGLCHSFHGPVNQAKQLLDSGKLGKLVHFYNRFAGKFEGVEQRWFVDPAVAGGGILLDTAVHSLSVFLHLVGDVDAVRAFLSTTLPITTEDSAALLLRGVNGVTGEISCSWVTTPGEWVFRLYGTQGVAEIDYDATPNLRYRLTQGDWVSVPYQGPDRFALEIRHFLDCVSSGATPLVSAAMGARTIAIIDEAYRSAGIARC
ncbi:MAG: Gfo/Idh/MocA family oxidoreductase [Chloroflexi bacterium]|nr:Gfo/Idh/MocA family oxidoreductase [Chloroflexota bacterium]